jgi:thiamine biosynthesis lipoprotein
VPAVTDGSIVFSARALGSPLRLTLTGVDQASADAAWDTVLDEFASTDRALSNYREDSSVTALNRRRADAPIEPTDPRLYAALALSDRAWRTTDGRFDPRVAVPLQRLGQPGPVRVVVGPHQPADRWLSRDPCSRSAGTSEPVDLGGIGKGLALRWAWRRLSRNLPTDQAGALLECGGDLVGKGPGPDGDAWLIAIEDPAADDEKAATSGGPLPLAVVGLRVGGLCTSSIRRARWLSPAGDPVHHLIDPRTGQPGGDGLLAVTVAWPDPAWAEIRTKELFLAGAAGIAPLARSADLAAWWVTTDGRLEMTPRARQMTHWP